MQTRIPDAVTDLLRQLQEKLQRRGETVATAESCTGGLVAYLLTELAGSSAIYLGGISSYANAVKTDCLGVPVELIERFGAVSAEVATAMAEGARQRIGSTYGVSLTGVAGPSGGTKLKPVGTVFCAIAQESGTMVYPLALTGDRHNIRWSSAVTALTKLSSVII